MAESYSNSPRPVITQELARELGLVRYFTGEPCRHGHVAERFVSSRGCVECAHIRITSDKRKQYAAEFREKNREKVQAEKRDYYEKNKERIKAVQLAYREKNRQRIRDVGKEYRRANPEIARAISLNAHHKRRAQMEGGMTGRELAAWRKSQPKVCYWCGKKCAKNFCIDHFFPLSKGGKHEASNLVIACPDCNARKRAKHPEDFRAEAWVGTLFSLPKDTAAHPVGAGEPA